MADAAGDWSSIRRGDTTVTFGKPLYGKPKIFANAPLSASNFDALIDALSAAKRQYLADVAAAQPEAK